MMLVFLLYVIGLVMSEHYDSYVNPNPRPYEQCNSQDLIKLSSCCNDILTKLDLCKSNDLACECCALQKLDSSCFKVCPNNPSNNFLTVLLNDCASLNDVNACNLPFNKDDSFMVGETEMPKSKARAGSLDQLSNQFTIKSKLKKFTDSNDEIKIDLFEYTDNEVEHSAIKNITFSNSTNVINVSNISNVSNQTTVSGYCTYSHPFIPLLSPTNF